MRNVQVRTLSICLLSFLTMYGCSKKTGADKIPYEPFQKINQMAGPPRWLALKEILLRQETVVKPPNLFLAFQRNGELQIKGLTEATSHWTIDEQSGFVKLSIGPAGEIVLRSFDIECSVHEDTSQSPDESGMVFCNILLSQNPIYKKPESLKEMYDESKYILLGMKGFKP